MSESELLLNAKQNLETGNYKAAINFYRQCCSIAPEKLEYFLELMLACILNKCIEEAQDIWLYLLLNKGEQDNGYLTERITQLLEDFCIKNIHLHRLDMARLLYEVIYDFNPDYSSDYLISTVEKSLDPLLSESITYIEHQQYEQAELLLKDILVFIDSPSVWYYLTIVFYKIDNYDQAMQTIRIAIEQDKTNGYYHYMLGLILEGKKIWNEAIYCYQFAIVYSPDLADAYNNLGVIFKKQGNIRGAIEIFKKALDRVPNHHGAYINLGNLLLEQKKYEEALAVYQNSQEYSIFSPDIYDGWSQALNHIGESENAILVLETGLKKFPNNWLLWKAYKLFLPVIYSTSKEATKYRDRYSNGLEELTTKLKLSIQSRNHFLNKFIAEATQLNQTNYYLAYQGKNDCELQIKYGDFLTSCMKIIYPQWSSPLFKKNKQDNAKIRVGYLSKRLKVSLLGKLLIGWLKKHNKNKFEIYSYYLGDLPETEKDGFQKHSDYYYHLPFSLNDICQIVKSNELDILVFFDIGIDIIMNQLASLRLAPIQCTTWGHPMTTGLNTIDYFISNQAMEGENAQSHYSEKLICLPRLGFILEQSLPINNLRNRSEFFLHPEDIVYISCQHISKYLPQDDILFPLICRSVSFAKIVFIERPGTETLCQKFKQRLKTAFARYGLNFSQYCLFLPGLDINNYYCLLQLADVFLDTIGWCGGITSLDAITCGLPIVTYPTQLLRGRQSYGIMKIIQVTETVATSRLEYVKIAVRLATDGEWRQTIKNKIKHNIHLLYNDSSEINELEAFYLSLFNRQ